jgi:glycosyltransferase involved in cell wall biosynthesis
MRVSIVMPTYNGIKYLNQAVASVLSQRHQDWELIISDDGSTDGSREFLSQIRDPRVKVHFQSQNLNIFGNLNFLFANAGSEITQILCQDDYFTDSAALGSLLAQWSALPGDIAYLRCNHTTDANSRLSHFEGDVLPSIVAPKESDLLFYIFGCIPGNLSNVSARTTAVAHAGWFRTDLPFAGDFEFWSRLGRTRPWAISRTNIVKVRSHSEQASRTMNPNGELLAQMRCTLETLYRSLIAEGYSPTLLRLMITTSHVSPHRDIGLKAVITGRGRTYLRRVSQEYDASEFALGSLMGWLTYLGSLGGRMFNISLAKQLLESQAQLLERNAQAG